MIDHDFPTNPILKNFLKDSLGSNSSKHNKTVEVGYTFRRYSFAWPLTFNKYKIWYRARYVLWLLAMVLNLRDPTHLLF